MLSNINPAKPIVNPSSLRKCTTTVALALLGRCILLSEQGTGKQRERRTGSSLTEDPVICSFHNRSRFTSASLPKPVTESWQPNFRLVSQWIQHFGPSSTPTAKRSRLTTTVNYHVINSHVKGTVHLFALASVKSCPSLETFTSRMTSFFPKTQKAE